MISVITVCRNAELFIAETLQSILNQRDTKFELVIVDGASTDATCSVIKGMLLDKQELSTPPPHCL